MKKFLVMGIIAISTVLTSVVYANDFKENNYVINKINNNIDINFCSLLLTDENVNINSNNTSLKDKNVYEESKYISDFVKLSSKAKKINVYFLNTGNTSVDIYVRENLSFGRHRFIGKFTVESGKEWTEHFLVIPSGTVYAQLYNQGNETKGVLRIAEQ